MSDASANYDVAIIGGGPGGSTTGALLRRYDPSLRVVILERENFPRPHVGESQLPPIGAILDEMGCWDAVEAANFPIKIGATYRWGPSRQLWDFEFLPVQNFVDEPRPAKYAGQRQQTALQVDREVYDDILLRQAESLGCEVREGTAVVEVLREDDRVTGLRLRDGSTITATDYVDASGHAGIIRRAMGVEVECPTALKNIAIWDYWENAAWAIEIGVGGTRVQIMSQDYGWLWFIPLGPTRTSIGLVCPAEYAKSSPLTPEQLYEQAIASDERISALCVGASRRGEIEATKDWSFVAARSVGSNWMLVGESAGFADPILAAGMTLTQTSAREAAYTLLEQRRGRHEIDWLRKHFDLNQRNRVRQHIRFADFWYASNGQFSDLQDHCREIAKDAGLELTSEQAWSWLARGGFTNDSLGQAGIGGLDLAGLKQITQRFINQRAKWRVSENNVVSLALDDAERVELPIYKAGKIEPVACYIRGDARLALTGMYDVIVKMIPEGGAVAVHQLLGGLQKVFAAKFSASHAKIAVHHAMQALEVMLGEGWLVGRYEPKLPRVSIETPEEGDIIHTNRDDLPASG